MNDETIQTDILEEDNKLSDQDIQDITETINDSVENNPNTELYEQAKEQADAQPVGSDVVEAKAKIILDPITGAPKQIVEEVDEEDDEDEDFHLQSFEEMLADESIGTQDIDVSTLEISNDSVNSVFNVAFPEISGKFTEMDYMMIMTAIKRVQKGEEFPYFNAMPQIIKDAINGMIGPQLGTDMGNYVKEGRNYIAKSFLDDIINNEFLDAATLDLQKTIAEGNKQKEMNIKQDDYWYNVRKYFLEDLINKSNKARAEGKTEEADRYDLTREQFTQSYTYKEMRELYNTTGKLKIKKIQIEKFDRECREFNCRYQKTQTVIQDISALLPCLNRHVNGRFGLNTLKEFICIFIKYTWIKNMSPNNIIDHVFMYFFIYNIISLDMYNRENEKDVAFHDELINNINAFLQDIEDKNNAKE